MNEFVVTVIVIALYLLYRIAFQHPPEAGKGHDTPQKTDTDTDDIVGKSRFVLPDRRQPAPTPATSKKSESQEEKQHTFVAESEKANAVIPSEALDEIFGEVPQPMDVDYPPERETGEPEDEPDAEEEAAELRQVLGKEAELAGGLTCEEMAEAIEAVNHPSDGGEEAARALSGLEKTDLFEQLVSGDAVKAARITDVLDRYEQSLRPPETMEEKGTDALVGIHAGTEYINFWHC